MFIRGENVVTDVTINITHKVAALENCTAPRSHIFPWLLKVVRLVYIVTGVVLVKNEIESWPTCPASADERGSRAVTRHTRAINKKRNDDDSDDDG